MQTAFFILFVLLILSSISLFIFELIILLIISFLFLVDFVLELRMSATDCFVLVALVRSLLVPVVGASVLEQVLVAAVVLKVLALAAEHCCWAALVSVIHVSLVSWIDLRGLVVATISSSALFLISSVIELVVLHSRPPALSPSQQSSGVSLVASASSHCA